MQKNNGKQESIQLSLFDSFTPEPPAAAPIIEGPAEEPLEEPLEEPVPERIEESEEESLSEEPVEESVEEVVAEEPLKPLKPSPPLTSTEELLQPMVIYFDANDTPQTSASAPETEVEPEIELEPKAEVEPVAGIEPEANPDPIAPIVPSDPIALIAPTAPIIPAVPTVSTAPITPSALPEEKCRILITGASGFIGGFLVREALNRGYEVWAGIRSGSSRARLRDERIHFIDLAYGEEIRLKKQLEEFRRDHGAWHYIIHNAGLTKTFDKSEFFRVNAGNTSRFVEALNAADCRPEKFLLMSSLSSYGPGDEKGFTPIRLEDEQRPDTAYGQSKLEAENIVRNQNYFPYVILRPTGVYGPGELDYFMEIKSIRSGFDFTVGMTPQRITFIYVKDLATVAFLALEKEDIRNRHYFVADGDVYTDHSFARMIQEIVAKKRVIRARIPSGLVYVACLFSEKVGKLNRKSMTLNTDKYKILKQRNWVCDVTPLQEDLGFTPAYSLREGLEEAIAWYIDEGWL
ncbi:nucleoside-diphosphate-sugar epimerase [Parabacteroides sp. PF5-6]|nr:nucleoside-diphosphate-sugar epimerase [Parabacteroides sp. PF5-6]